MWVEFEFVEVIFEVEGWVSVGSEGGLEVGVKVGVEVVVVGASGFETESVI